MGIKGTVRRSTDGHIIHANIDTDVIIAEEPPYGWYRHCSCDCLFFNSLFLLGNCYRFELAEFPWFFCFHFFF